MKKIRLFIAVLLSLWVMAPALAAAPVKALLFTAPWCPHCQHLKKDGFIEQFNEKYKGKIEIQNYDVTQKANNVLFLAKLREHPEASEGIPALFIGDKLLQGYPTPIATQADQAAQALLAVCAQTVETPSQENTGEQAQEDDRELHTQLFKQITLWTIIVAGLVDGINPCAFAVIVFFVSFLAAYKYSRKEIIVVGIAYCSSVFLAYMLMGLGVFHVLYAMESFHYAAIAIQWGILILCALFFVLSAYDFIVYKRTKKSDNMILQLSKKSKNFIHKVMRFFLKDKRTSLLRLLAAAFVVGFVVSGVEAVCTGQVYLPTIKVILKESHQYFFKAAVFLVIYNLMFITPLVLVFALTLCGKESAVFNNWLKKHLGLAKLLLCAVFLGLLVLLIATMF